MKNVIYIIITAMLLLISLLVLLFYYTQDFSETFSFPKALSYTDLILKIERIPNPTSATPTTPTTYLSSAEAVVGELALENNGYFTQKYEFPQLFGCINIKQLNEDKKLRMEINYNPSENSAILDYHYSYAYNPIEIKVGEKKIFKLKGIFYGNTNIPVSLFSKENKITLEIYQILKKELNPLGENYNRNYYNSDCTGLNDAKKISTILIDLEAMPDLTLDSGLPQPEIPQLI